MKQPKILSLVKKGITRTLDTSSYPFIGPQPSSPKNQAAFQNVQSNSEIEGAQGNYFSNRTSTMQVKNNSKFIVFVLGGISHQEIAALANFER